MYNILITFECSSTVFTLVREHPTLNGPPVTLYSPVILTIVN
jgi:hypothetical protein